MPVCNGIFMLHSPIAFLASFLSIPNIPNFVKQSCSIFTKWFRNYQMMNECIPTLELHLHKLPFITAMFPPQNADGVYGFVWDCLEFLLQGEAGYL